MSKVRLTEKQAEALEQVKESRGKDKVMNGVLGKWYRELEPLNDLNPSQMARALYIGYEVEPEFNVGDWVAYKYWGLVGKVVCTVGGIALDNKVGGNLNPKDFKRATPEEIAEEKERRWWKSHNRDVWELKDGDIVYINHELLTVFKVHGNELHVYESKHIFAMDLLKRYNNVEVVCFAEDRKDVDNE